MIALGERTRTEAAGEHVRLMQALGRELERAMGAIARNDLPELEDSIATQQSLSCALGELARQMRAPVDAGCATDSLDGSLRGEIRKAVARLQDLNLRYSILLQHSSRSAAQMAALFHSVRGQFQEDAGARPKHQTWSCQI